MGPPSWATVVDGVEQEGGGKDTMLTFSRDGKHFAYLEPAAAGMDRVVVDGVPRNVKGKVDLIQLSPDGSRLAYRFMRGYGGPQHQTFYNLDGVDSLAYEDVWNIEFSADGKTCVCTSSNEQTKHFYLSVNGKVTKEYDWIGKPLFSADGSRLAFAA